MADRAAQILRARRLELGMTQEEVAFQLGMSIHQYQRYEYGEHRIANCRMRHFFLSGITSVETWQ